MFYKTVHSDTDSERNHLDHVTMKRYQLHLIEAKKPFITISSTQNDRCTQILATVSRIALLLVIGGFIVYVMMECWKSPIVIDRDTQPEWNIKNNGTHSNIGLER